MYSFTVPVGLASVQVSLENRTGNPYLGLPTVPDWLGRPNHTVGDYSENYGLDEVGTGAAVLQGPSFVTLANPTPGTYTVAVRASSTAEFGTFPDAGYAIRVQGLGTINVPFDGGSAGVAAQLASSWRFFRIDVPAGVVGWDVRLTNVTSGSPQLVVRRDQLPASLQNAGFDPGSAQAWPSGAQWAAGVDLTGYEYDADGSDTIGRVLHMGMGLPLEPGTYYVGVTNASGTSAAMSYTLESRGIGTGYAIPVTTLAYAGGSDTQSNLAPRELAYYKVTVPAGQTSWQVKLTATTGDVALFVRKNGLPSTKGYYAGYGWDFDSFGNNLDGVQMRKAGDEHFVLLPTYATSNRQTATTVPAGDYYLAVVSQGGTNVGATPTNQNGPQMGTGNAGYTILSRGGVQTAGPGRCGGGRV